MEFCPHCNELKNMIITTTYRFEDDPLGEKQKIKIETYHCETCNQFVRTKEDIVIPI